jgi:Cys-rich four helix bundle protein (predicted Tat secretion target)
MHRRELLIAAGSVVAAGITTAAAQETPEHHHDASGSPLVDSALHCVKAGNVCQAHCFDLLAKGDTSIADCARSVESVRAVCGTLAVLAAQNSPLLPHYAAVAKEACDGCEKECRKHSDKHAVCKACAEACASCAKECARVAA